MQSLKPIPVRPVPPLPADVGAELFRSVTRAATAALLNQIHSPHAGRGERVLAECWPADRNALAILTRAATAPATTTTAGWAAELSVATTASAFLSSLPASDASRLFAAGLMLPLDGVASINVPYAAATPSLAPSIVVEGAPIPVRQAGFTTLTLGPIRKLAVLTELTNELGEHSTPVAELVIRQVLVAAATAALDQAVFTSSAGGLLDGVAPLTATAGGGQAALLGDIGQLVSAITTAGGGARLMLFAAPNKSALLPIYAAGVGFLEVVPTPALLPGTIVMLDPAGVVSGTSGQPRIDVGRETAVHLENTTPLQIATGSPGSAVLATPVRSAFQTDIFALRLTLDFAFAAQPGYVQHITGVTW